MNVVPPAPLAGRLLSLDAYRGFIMLAMVSAGFGTAKLEGHPTWGVVQDQLVHRDWVGCNFWDLIQPSFMFMVGVAMPLAFAKRQEQGQSWRQQFGHVVKRCALLIGIGIVMDSFAHPVPTIQFIRVLQQIAIGYCIAFFVVHRSVWTQGIVAGSLLLAHTAAYLLYTQFNDLPWGNAWIRNANVGAWIDRSLHEPFERWGYPELLPMSKGGYVTINAISSAATILFGVMVGRLLRSGMKGLEKAGILLLAGLFGIAAGWALALEIPMVKKLWTASFALYAAGFTCLMMLAFYAIIDLLGWRGWSFPFMVVGVNSIAIYFSSGILGGVFRDLWKPFTFKVFDPSSPFTPVVTACLVMAMQWLLCYLMYRNRVFWKV